jgi:ATP/ADP translocase
MGRVGDSSTVPPEWSAGDRHLTEAPELAQFNPRAPGSMPPPAKIPRRFARPAFAIGDTELRIVMWAGLALTLLGWADVSMQNAAETMFLKRLGVEYLPLAFLVSSILLVMTTYVAGRFAVRANPETVLPITFGVLALSLLPVWLFTVWELPGVYALLILVSKQLRSIALLVFWIAMGNLLNARQAKRLFAPFLAGITLGGILGSFASAPLGEVLGIPQLLALSSVVLGLAALATMPLSRAFQGRLDRRMPGRQAPQVEGESEANTASLAELWRDSKLFRILAVTTLCSGLVGPMLYFQFSYVADVATAGAGGEQRLLSLYAQFRGWINLAILVGQLSLAAIVYRLIGLPLAAALSPAIYVIGFCGLTFDLSLPMAIGAVSGARLWDNAVYEPAQRIIFNLFSGKDRQRVVSLLDPIKRAGGAIGNLIIMAVLAVALPIWVGVAAVPISLLWLIVSLALWRTYPALLLEAYPHRGRLDDEANRGELLDPRTLRALVMVVIDPDPRRSNAALTLLSDAPPDLAAATLAGAAAAAPAGGRASLIEALGELLERHSIAPLGHSPATRSLEDLLQSHNGLDPTCRASLVQAAGQLLADPIDLSPFTSARSDTHPAIGLAGLAALHRLGGGHDLPDLDDALDKAIRGNDPVARRIARRELRHLLMHSDVDELWTQRLRALAQMTSSPDDRPAVSEAIAGIAARHGDAAAVVSDTVLAKHASDTPRMRAAILRYIGHAGLVDQTPQLVESIASSDASEAAAAKEALLALGPRAARALMVEHCFGKRSNRDAILSIVRELGIETETLRSLYERELEDIRHTFVILDVLRRGDTHPILLQRIGERTEEGLNTALLFLQAIHRDPRILRLGSQLRYCRGEHQHGVLLEALESLLAPREKEQLMPLLEDTGIASQARTAAAQLSITPPGFDEVERSLQNDSDELTVAIARALKRPLDGGPELEKDEEMLTRLEIALLLKTIPLFARLSSRQLMDLAATVEEEEYESGTIIFREGDGGTCMYVISEGRVRVEPAGSVLIELGPQQFFGEMALLEQVNRSATVTAVDNVRLLRLGRTNFLSLMEELPGLAIGICQALSQRLREANERASATA